MAQNVLRVKWENIKIKVWHMTVYHVVRNALLMELDMTVKRIAKVGLNLQFIKRLTQDAEVVIICILNMFLVEEKQ